VVAAAPLSPCASALSPDALARLREENRILKKGVLMLAGMRERLLQALNGAAPAAAEAAAEAADQVRALTEENERLQRALTSARAGAVMQSLLQLGLSGGDADAEDERGGGGGGHGGGGGGWFCGGWYGAVH
jgi:hypothetical protein